MNIRLVANIEQISSEDVTLALQTAVAQVRRNLPVFTYRCQNHSSVNNFYPDCDNNQWTCGFWPGQIWLAYEYTNDTVFRDAGDILVKDFLNRIISKIEVDHHDMGFLYTPSCVSAYMLTGNEEARTAALLAADQLMSRFQQTGEFLQAWGAMNADDNYRYIIDCLLNLPLLYWAERETGDKKYADIAMRHTRTCLKYSIRSDGSTFHTVYMNKTTGEFERGETCQGYSHDSSWARGQAWAIYGTALSYANSGMKHHYEAFANVLAYYLSRLPADMVPCWDLIFSDGDGEPRDSSSTSIVACGLLEMSRHCDILEAEIYSGLARQMMQSLWQNYAVRDPAVSNGQVLHGTYSKKSPFNTCTPEGVDECVSWGDYFYFEALMRLDRNWQSYWL